MAPTAQRWLGRMAMAATAAWLLAGPVPAMAQSTMKLVPQADLKIFDPISTTAAITQNHGLMVYDTLFALNSKLEPKPQMVESYTTSPDGMKWTFTLRPGLKWHDGTPVTAKDVAASINRWSKHTARGGFAMMQRAQSLVAKDDKTVELTFKEKFGPVREMLADPSLPVFIMREKDAMTDPFQAVTESVGSGPFLFVKEEWVPGSKVVYKKNPNYVPRNEPSDGFAGGKVAKLDRVEWIYIPDTNTAAQALLAGEVDAIEQPPYDLLPAMKKDKNITVRVLDPLGKMGHIRPNHLHPPFNNVKAREALQLLVDQKEFLAAMVGNPEYEKECYAIFMCGSPLETTKHSENHRKPNVEKAKQLFKEAGYKGEKIVIMQPTDQQLIGTIAVVMAQKLREAGINVDLQAMDWGTLITRRTKQDAPGQGSPGWNIFPTWWTGIPMSNPITNAPLVTTCDKKNWFGWPCDEQMEKLRADYVKAGTLAEQKAAAEAMQKRYFETFPYINTGQFTAPVAYRNNLKGVPNALLLVAWNIEKTK
ncbi:MAG: ABC transporter substrate-binding protein [Alphaproteobacteria bacterium]|nr:ABC transporter substrate-binding protein [Alphaproteobacteria bacterium]